MANKKVYREINIVQVELTLEARKYYEKKAGENGYFGVRPFLSALLNGEISIPLYKS
jgi:hypothetical protein